MPKKNFVWKLWHVGNTHMHTTGKLLFNSHNGKGSYGVLNLLISMHVLEVLWHFNLGHLLVSYQWSFTLPAHLNYLETPETLRHLGNTTKDTDSIGCFVICFAVFQTLLFIFNLSSLKLSHMYPVNRRDNAITPRTLLQQPLIDDLTHFIITISSFFFPTSPKTQLLSNLKANFRCYIILPINNLIHSIK